MAKATILFADNDPDFLKTRTEFLERDGYQVIPAADPTEARCILERGGIDLAILDIRLRDDDDEKDTSGLTLAKKAARPLPKIILTAFPSVDAVREALRPQLSGLPTAVDFVSKPEGPEALVQAVQRVLGSLAKQRDPERPVKVFLCYARPDRDRVDQLYENLSLAGLEPWMDTHRLLPGEKWERAIRKTIREADFFVVCISKKSVNRRGFMQKEIRMALDIWDEKLEDDIYLIPARLEDCDIPDERLRSAQWVDLFHPDGLQKLIQALQVGMNRRI